MNNPDNETESHMREDGQNEYRTLEIEVELDESHQNMVSDLESAGVDVEEVVSEQLRRAVEETVHDVYQRVKYSQN